MQNNQCKYCGSDRIQLLPGKGKHFAQLKCECCGKWQKWVSKKSLSYKEIIDINTHSVGNSILETKKPRYFYPDFS
mgnify:FL=1